MSRFLVLVPTVKSRIENGTYFLCFVKQWPTVSFYRQISDILGKEIFERNRDTKIGQDDVVVVIFYKFLIVIFFFFFFLSFFFLSFFLSFNRERINETVQSSSSVVNFLLFDVFLKNFELFHSWISRLTFEPIPSFQVWKCLPIISNNV